MTDKGAVCLGVAIVVAAGLIYLAAKNYNETVSASVASANGSHGVAVSAVHTDGPFGFDLSGVV